MLNEHESSKKLALNVRRLALEMVTRASGSHIGSALSICDILSVLYGRIMCFASKYPAAEQRDRFILSKGHACVAVYGILAELGFISHAALETYGQDYSILSNHISHKVPGVEFSTGSLGHGLPFGVGKALAAKMLNRDWKTYVLLSDGELGEGSNWESMMFAAHHKLDNLIAIIDYNKLQSLTTVEKTLGLEPISDKINAFGWAAKQVDGHDHLAIYDLLSTAPWEVGKPSMLIAHTVKGKGVSFMEGKIEWHYRSPNQKQLEQALSELKYA